MNTSFDLISSMSPKLNKNYKPIKKVPTKLALKKYFRKSFALENANTSRHDESVITVTSSSTCSSCSSSSSSKNVNKTPIIISDSEVSFRVDKTPKKVPSSKDNPSVTHRKKETNLSTEKFTNIQHWIDDVNSAKRDCSIFSELSAISGDDNHYFKVPKTNVAVNSTFLRDEAKRFDQLFQTKEFSDAFNFPKSDKDEDENDTSSSSELNNQHKNNLVIDDSLTNDGVDEQDDMKSLFSDSFDLDESLNSRLQKKNTDQEKCMTPTCGSNSVSDSVEYENLLDSIYGTSWREKKEDILPSSEPRIKLKQKIITKAPNTERCPDKKKNCDIGKNDNNLLKHLQKTNFKKAIESPWLKSLKKLCDSDTESDKSETNRNILSPVKLNFDEDSNSQVSLDTKLKKQVQIKSDKNKIQPLKNKNTESRTYSFLASLSGSVPVDKCDISALIFRNNFQQQKEALASKLFNLFNEKVFDSLIPKDTPIEWNDRMRGTAGTCSCKKITRRTGLVERTVKIVLARKVLDSADRLRDTLIHEMCHAATWIVNQVADGHGSFWKAWAGRAMKTFPELPPIKRCHNYVINTKYTYKCTGCGYSIGRHTKSLDTERKRCGYCYGTFQVLINKISKQGETKSVPVTPKKPSGFALFVKENYANYKAPDLKHGDVMKLLGQKFADLKVDKS